MMMMLNVGDKVKLTRDYSGWAEGTEGTILNVRTDATEPYPYRVSFPENYQGRTIAQCLQSSEIELVAPVPLFKAGDKVRSKAFGGGGDTILAYFPTAIEARKVYDIAAGGRYGNEDKPIVIYSVNTKPGGRQRVAWDFAESVELMPEPEPEPVKKDYTQLLKRANAIVGVFEGSPLADTVHELIDALREETSNANA